MKKFFFTLIFIPTVVFSQKGTQETYVGPRPHETVQTQRLKAEVNFSDISEIEIKGWVANTLGINATDLALLDQRESPMGFHFHFQQTLAGLPILHKKVKVNIGKDQKTVVVFYEVSPSLTTTANSFPVLNALPSTVPSWNILQSENVFYADGDLAIPCVQFTVESPLKDQREWTFNAQGELLNEELTTAYFHSETDTNITVSVFNPDPLTTAGVTYGTPYTDQGDQNTLLLDAQMEVKTILANYSNGYFNLSNYAVTIQDLEGPADSAIQNLTDQFHFSRNQNAFNQVNAFYHITQMKDHLTDIGHPNLMNYSILVDANAFFGQDNSRFQSGSLYFGNGGVDDAEDADVIIHEYGHAMSNNAAPGTNSGTERRCLDEANGDYFAASYSKFINPFGYERVFSWDGHNEFWPGRFASNTQNKNYNNISFNSSIYQHTDLWSAMVMDINTQLGRDTADFLLACSIYGYASNMTFEDAAFLILLCDIQNFDAGHRSTLCSIFATYGLNTPCTIGIQESLKTIDYRLLSSTSFAGGGNAVLEWNDSESATVEFYNLQGQLIHQINLDPNSKVSIPSTPFSSGIIIGRILTTSGATDSFKLVKH